MDAAVIFHVLIAFGALQAIFLSGSLLVSRGNLAKKLFAFFLLIEGFTLIERLLAETDLMHAFPHLLGISYPLSFLKPPLLFLLALALTRSEFRLQLKHLLHLIPFVLMLGLNLPFYGMPAAAKVKYVADFVDYVPAYSDFNFWFFLSFFVYIALYLSFSIRELRSFQRHIKNNRLANGYVNVLYFYAALLGVLLIHFALRPTGAVEFPYINEASMLLMTFLIQSIAYQLLSNSKLLQESNAVRLSAEDPLAADVDRIRNRLEQEKVYLDDTLNLADFAASLQLSTKKVSDIFNQRFGDSFKGIVNQYRVEEAKALMSGQPGAKVKIVEVGLRSGFNNKVSFYRTFKKLTGKSPSDYFQSLQKNQ